MLDVEFREIKGQLHKSNGFGRIKNSPWYRDAVYERFSDAEYQRRFKATQEKMARLGLDVRDDQLTATRQQLPGGSTSRRRSSARSEGRPESGCPRR